MTFERIKEILNTKKVGIAGCGGLGSNCAVALARTGIGTLVIADFDVIVMGNLNRQYYFFNQLGYIKVHALKENIKKINPQVHVISYDKKLTPPEIVHIFGDCDVIVEAFDMAEMKKMIIETVQTEMPDKPLVIGLGMAGYGRNDLIKSRNIGNLYICGDEVSEISEDMPPLAPRVGIVAHMQANQVIEILLDSHE
ncbi:MAG: sulfur carrier protein ThiS adenylyltransferase ThiF [Bacteroidia bacterium]|nr:sulfur carrier protein ThiS adenylyltransferase ThiF [Bacteroidia bacterium]